MNKRFLLKNKLWVYIVSCAVSIILLACCIVNILQLCEVGTLRSYNTPLTITSTVISFLVLVVIAFTILGSGYTLSKKCLLTNIGFIFSRTMYSNILKARTNADKTMLIIYVESKNNGDIYDEESGLHADIYSISISPNKVDMFVDGLKEHNPEIFYEIYTPEIVENNQKKDKEDKKK